MNFFVIFTVFMLLSSYCMIMWNHSSNFMDTVILKQQYEQRYYLCAALLDYAVAFYKSEHLLLKSSDSKLFKNWPDVDFKELSGQLYSGKISWENADKTVKIKAELINKNKPEKIEFTMQSVLSVDSQDNNAVSCFDFLDDIL